MNAAINGIVSAIVNTLVRRIQKFMVDPQLLGVRLSLFGAVVTVIPLAILLHFWASMAQMQISDARMAMLHTVGQTAASQIGTQLDAYSRSAFLITTEAQTLAGWIQLDYRRTLNEWARQWVANHPEVGYLAIVRTDGFIITGTPGANRSKFSADLDGTQFPDFNTFQRTKPDVSPIKQWAFAHTPPQVGTVVSVPISDPTVGYLGSVLVLVDQVGLSVGLEKSRRQLADSGFSSVTVGLWNRTAHSPLVLIGNDKIPATVNWESEAFQVVSSRFRGQSLQFSPVSWLDQNLALSIMVQNQDLNAGRSIRIYGIGILGIMGLVIIFVLKQFRSRAQPTVEFRPLDSGSQLQSVSQEIQELVGDLLSQIKRVKSHTADLLAPTLDALELRAEHPATPESNRLNQLDSELRRLILTLGDLLHLIQSTDTHIETVHSCVNQAYVDTVAGAMAAAKLGESGVQFATISEKIRQQIETCKTHMQAYSDIQIEAVARLTQFTSQLTQVRNDCFFYLESLSGSPSNESSNTLNLPAVVDQIRRLVSDNSSSVAIESCVATLDAKINNLLTLLKKAPISDQ